MIEVNSCFKFTSVFLNF